MSEGQGDERRFDWEAARAKLKRALEDLRGEPSDEQVNEMLEQRAVLLARTPEEDLFREGDIQLLIFLAGGEKYALAAECVRYVAPLERYTPIPCTPPFVMGAFNVRGQVYSLVDIRSFLGLQVEQDHVYRTAMLVESEGIQVGFAVDEVFDVIGVRPEDLSSGATAEFAIDKRHVRGLTRDLTVVLDPPSILGDSRFIVHEEVGSSKHTA